MTEPVIPDRAIGKYERICFERHDRDLALCGADGRQHPKGFRFEPELGDRVVQFVERFCRHHKGEWAGRPLLLEQWQKRIIRIAFGWIKPEPGAPGQWVRRFRTVYIEIARKNGKSEMCAALGLYLALADDEAGAEVYSSATKRDQAKIVWGTAKVMVEKSPALLEFIKPYQTSLQIAKTSSFFQPLGADADTLDGLNPHGNIVDELHAHRDRKLWDVLRSAMGARRQPMTLAITTAGVLDETGIGWEQHDYAMKILDGTFEDDTYFAFIAAADEEDKDKWFDVETQQKANPNWGISVKPDYLAAEANVAKSTPGALHGYLTKHLNVWSQEAQRWLRMDRWAACEAAGIAPADRRALFEAREQLLRGKTCRAGLDLSSRIDLCALVLEFQGAGEELFLLPYFWIPEERIKFESNRGRRHYESWQRDGWLYSTPGDVIDYEFIRVTINNLAALYDIREIAFDPWNAVDLSNRLTADGRTMVECRMGYQTLSEPCKDLEAKVIQAKVRHSLHPVMSWNAANAVALHDHNDNIRPVKQTVEQKIDGVVAWAMARSRGIVNKEEDNAYRDGDGGRGSFISF